MSNMPKTILTCHLSFFTQLLCISLLLIAIIERTVPQVSACTSAYHAPSHIMLKSYDWHDGSGDLYFNPKGLNRKAFPHEKSPLSRVHSWQSTFASVTFNQYGRSFPNGGLNEAGLAIEVLWLEQSAAAVSDHRPYLNELEWVQFALDTQSSVADLIKISPNHPKSTC